MAFDDKYVKYAYTAVRSAFLNKDASDDLAFFILQSDVTVEHRKCLESLVSSAGGSIEFLDVDENAVGKELPVAKGWPAVIYYRLMLPELLSERLDRILYLDADIIVNHSLSGLFGMDLNGALIGASRNFAPINGDTYKNRRLFERICDCYMSSGLLLMDLKKLSEEGYTFRKYMDAAEELQYELVMPDMDLINYVHKGRFLEIDRYRYNLFAAEAYNEGIKADRAKDSAVIQYAGYKPWQGGHIHFDTEKIWWDYAKGSPFYAELAEIFISECLTDPFVYDSFVRISSEKQSVLKELDQCREELKLRKELNEKLLAIVNEGRPQT